MVKRKLVLIKAYITKLMERPAFQKADEDVYAKIA